MFFVVQQFEGAAGAICREGQQGDDSGSIGRDCAESKKWQFSTRSCYGVRHAKRSGGRGQFSSGYFKFSVSGGLQLGKVLSHCAEVM